MEKGEKLIREFHHGALKVGKESQGSKGFCYRQTTSCNERVK